MNSTYKMSINYLILKNVLTHKCMPCLVLKKLYIILRRLHYTEENYNNQGNVFYAYLL